MLYKKGKVPVVLSKGWTIKKRQEFRLMPLPLFLLDADSPSTNLVVVNVMMKQPINQSFYL